jgi:hypothetical protein
MLQCGGIAPPLLNPTLNVGEWSVSYTNRFTSGEVAEQKAGFAPEPVWTLRRKILLLSGLEPKPKPSKPYYHISSIYSKI